MFVGVIKVIINVLCDTVCIWALYFRDSAYRKHVLELRSENKLYCPISALWRLLILSLRQKVKRSSRNMLALSGPFLLQKH